MIKEEILKRAKELYEKSSLIEEKIEIIIRQINELKELEKGATYLVNYGGEKIFSSVGKGIYVKLDDGGKINFFVDVGCGIVVKKRNEEILKIINEQINKLSEVYSDLNEELMGLKENFNYLTRQIELHK